MKNERKYTYTYNCKTAVSSPAGTKQSYVMAKDKIEAKIKINEYLDRINGELCIEFF